MVFTRPYPERVIIMWGDKVWIDRDLDGNTPSINFNTIYEGNYSTDVPGTITSKPLTIKPCTIEDYAPERNLDKPFRIVYNPKLGLNDTPARIFAKMEPEAIIEVGRKFYTFSPQVRMFILLHELGHMRYATEHKADCYALKRYLEMGLNPSQAFYALSKVLHPGKRNQDRILKLFNELKSNNYVSEK